jgi:tetratricopeptide (TPR) repeat protein
VFRQKESCAGAQRCASHEHLKAARKTDRKAEMAICGKRVLLIALLTAGLEPWVLAKDLRIAIPRRSHLAPVQRLNREGVAAVQRGHYDKAKAIFYKAYLLDPGDPFTLNNLGYVAELEGQEDRAETLYGLASGQGTEAFIDKASSPDLKGKLYKLR